MSALGWVVTVAAWLTVAVIAVGALVVTWRTQDGDDDTWEDQ